MGRIRTGSWKRAAIALAAGILTALASGLVIALVHDDAAAESRPPALTQNESVGCEGYRHETHTDGGRVVKNGLIGGALGAGLGAAGGAIGGKAGKGAGIGALVGAVAGSGYTLYDEHGKKQAARRAYGDCLGRGGS